jgi:hypothetical protein
VNIAEALEAAARPVLVVPASERVTPFALQMSSGQLMQVYDPAAVFMRPGTAPAWDTARRLVEDDA